MAKDSKRKKVEKYITEIKELPGEGYESIAAQGQLTPESAQKSAVEPQNTTGVSDQKMPADGKSKVVKKAAKKQKQPISGEKNSRKNSESSLETSGVSGRKLPLSTKDIILGLINLITLALLIILLTKLPDKAQTLRNLKNESLIDESSIRVQNRSIEENQEKVEKLEGVFLDESGVVEFVNDIERLRSEGGVITELTFENQTAVKDRTGAFGIPVNIELQGTWGQIGQDLEKIEELPYLFRPVRIAARPVEFDGEEDEEPLRSLINFQYGGVLYVDKKLAEN